MNWYSIFYWLTVADNAKSFFWFFAVVFTIIAIISTFGFIDASYNKNNEEDVLHIRKWLFWSYPFAMLFWAGIVFTPSKKDSLLIVAGGGTLQYLTTDSSAKQIPHELTSFVLTELKSMSEDVKVEMNVQSQKEKILESAKQMTTEELLNKMQVDSNFAKIVLDKK